MEFSIFINRRLKMCPEVGELSSECKNLQPWWIHRGGGNFAAGLFVKAFSEGLHDFFDLLIWVECEVMKLIWITGVVVKFSS